MKLPRILFLFATIHAFTFAVSAQSIVGNWQLVKEGRCLEEAANSQDDSLESLRAEMHSRSSATPQVVSFKANSSGEESTRILNSSRAANLRKFYYKFNGEVLLILDKKSQTISNSYMVDKFTSDSLIISNSSRPCETRIFVKISQELAN